MAEMDRKQLMIFIRQICNNSPDDESARMRLQELLNIMEQQKVSAELLPILSDAIAGLPETKERVKNTAELSAEDLAIIHRRANHERIMEAISQGRC